MHKSIVFVIIRTLLSSQTITETKKKKRKEKEKNKTKQKKRKVQNSHGQDKIEMCPKHPRQ